MLGPIVYLLALGVAAYLTVSADLRPSPPSAVGADHTYPPNPATVERPKIVGEPPTAPASRTLRRGHFTDPGALAAALPPGTLRAEGHGGWLLTAPVAITSGASVDINGGSLDLARGAFLLAERGGAVKLTNVAVTGLGPAPTPTAPGNRGFLSAEEGGQLILHDDVISRLGHPGVHSYGISFWAPAKGSAVTGSTIRGNYFGVYLTHAVGVLIAHNRVLDSIVYGIDPHTDSRHITIVGNTVVGSGVHGIILADLVTASLVKDNTVMNPIDHGIVVFDRSNGDVIQGNRVIGAIDGIVVQDSSNTTITGNTVEAKRFGIRISGHSQQTSATDNSVSGSLVGAYVYAGPSGTTLTGNRFSGVREPVRVRSDATGTVVQPVPPRSELGASTTGGHTSGLPWWLPLSLLGAFVWGSWSVRQYLGWRYRPRTQPYEARTSVVVPVFREDPQVLERCLLSWQRNGSDEILLVIDHTEQELIPLARGWARQHAQVRVVVVEPPGKRHALVVGIREATNPIVMLTDSDTMWEDGFLPKMLSPFSDPTIGGVGCRQNVYRPGASLWRRVADWMLDVRFIHQLPAAARRDAIPCISGRTAAYRRDVILPMLDDFEFETFLGRPCVSGDDGRLTWLVLHEGWGTAYQLNARAWTVFPNTFRGFLKQRVRWSRNSYRCYTRAIGRGWLWREPVITSVTVIQNLVGPFTLSLAVFFLVRAIVDKVWLVAAVTVAWLMVGRALKGIGHLVSEPASLLYVPLVTIVFIAVMIPVKFFSLFTLNRQGWMTRLVDGQVAEGQGGSTLGD